MVKQIVARCPVNKAESEMKSKVLNIFANLLMTAPHLSVSSMEAPSPPSVECECGGDAGDAVSDDVDPE